MNTIINPVRTRKIFQIVSTCIIAAITMLLWLFYHQAAVRFIQDLIQLFRDKRMISIYLRTLHIAGATTGISMSVGLALSYFLYETPLPLRRLLGTVFFWPLLLPPYFLASAWLSWLGDFGIVKTWGFKLNNIGGCVFLLSLYLIPLVILTVGNSLGKITSEQKEAALMLGGSWKYFHRIWLPAAFPGACGGGLLALVFAANHYSIPAILTLNTVSTEIYAEFGAFYNYYTALLKITPFLLLFGLVALWLGKYARGAFTTDSASKIGYPRTGKTLIRGTGFALWIAYITGAIGLPGIGLVWRCGSWVNLYKAVSMAGEQLGFSLWFSVVSAGLLTLVGLGAAYAYLRRKIRGILSIVTVLLVIPPVFGAIGLIFLLNRPGLDLLYRGGGLLFAGYLIRFIALIFVLFLPAIRAIPPEWEEASWLTGQSQWTTWRKIIFPLIFPAFLMIWLVAFFLCFGEAEASILLYPPGAETVSIRILSLLHYGTSPIVNGLVVLQLMILGLTAIGCRFIIGKMKVKTK